jgi:hypothetical protein
LYQPVGDVANRRRGRRAAAIANLDYGGHATDEPAVAQIFDGE